jgi:hypothetical protein
MTWDALLGPWDKRGRTIRAVGGKPLALDIVARGHEATFSLSERWLRNECNMN